MPEIKAPSASPTCSKTYTLRQYKSFAKHHAYRRGRLRSVARGGIDVRLRCLHGGATTRRAARRWTRRLIRRQRDPWRETSFVVAGRVSIFGYPTDGSQGHTADGGDTKRPCIAIRDDSTLGRWFRVTVLGHTAVLLHCDFGPAVWTARDIDITGLGAIALHLSVSNFPTDSWGRVVMLARRR